MTINSQKLLPPSKFKYSSAIVKVDDITKQSSIVRKKVINIDRIFTSTLVLQRKRSENKKEDVENDKRLEKEEQLERKKNKILSGFKLINLPKLGFLDAINRFIIFTLIGWAFKRLYPFIPKILEFIKNFTPVIKFIEVLSGKFFSSIVNFIDSGYKAYDSVRSFTKTLGGESLQKTFDDFSGNLNKFINLAIIAGMLSTGGPNFGGGKSKFGLHGEIKRGRFSSFNRGFGDRQGFNLWEQRAKGGKLTTVGLRKAENDIMKRYFQRYGREAFIRRFGEEGLKKLPSGMGRGLFQRGVRGAFMRTFGRGGVRFTRGATKAFGKVPVIGGLIDFVIRTLIFKESPDRAAAGAIGATLGTAIGSVIATSGTIASMGLGSIIAPLVIYASGVVGDWIGTSLFDTIKFYQSQNQPIKKQAVGGKVTTRKGKVVGGAIKRSLRKPITAPKGTPVKPGSSVGGKSKIQKVFPEVPKEQKGKMVDPFGLITNVTKSMSEVPFLGQFASLMGSILLGEFPGPKQIKNIASGINAWINNAIARGTLKGNLVQGFADGGMIDIESEMKKDITGWAQNSIELLIKNKVTNAINEVKKNLMLLPLSSFRAPSGGDLQGVPGGVSMIGGGLQGIDKGVILAQMLMNDLGITMASAAGIVGNLYLESSGLTPGEKEGPPYGVNEPPWPLGTIGRGYGWAQWTNSSPGDRLDKFIKSYGGDKGKIATDQDNYNFLLNEIRGANPITGIPTDDPAAAATWFRSKWERAGVHNDSPRISTAKEIFKRLQQEGKTSRIGKGWTQSIIDNIQLGSEKGSLKQAEEIGKSMGLNITSRYRAGDSGYHGKGRAIDFQTPGKPGNKGTSQQMALAQEFIKKFGSSITELIYTPLGFGIKNGKRVPLSVWGPLSPPWADLPSGHPLKNSTNAIHYDHVHIAFQKGGDVKQKLQPLKKQTNIKPLESQAFYEEFESTQTLILPIIIEKQVLVPIRSRSTTLFK